MILFRQLKLRHIRTVFLFAVIFLFKNVSLGRMKGPQSFVALGLHAPRNNCQLATTTHTTIAKKKCLQFCSRLQKETCSFSVT